MFFVHGVTVETVPGLINGKIAARLSTCLGECCQEVLADSREDLEEKARTFAEKAYAEAGQ